MITTESNHGAGPRRPVLDFEQVENREIKVSLDLPVIEQVDRYVEYVKETQGKNVRVSRDLVVEKSLRKVLKADAGFRDWLREKMGS